MNKFLIAVMVMIVGVLMFFTFSIPKTKKVVVIHGSRSTTKSIVKKSVTTPPKAIIVVKKDKMKEKPDDFGKKVYAQKGKAAYEYNPPKTIPKAKIVPDPTKQSKPKPKIKSKPRQ
jgi:hypothetical protein